MQCVRALHAVWCCSKVKAFGHCLSAGPDAYSGTQRVTEAIALSAVWASQKIMEQSDRWRRQIKPAEPVNISPEVKVCGRGFSSRVA